MPLDLNNISESLFPYLNEIAERLWAGRAAVMVGSGFSKNANPAFPTWNQLGDIFYIKAYGKKPTHEDKAYLNVLRLAQEVESAIGRPALEDLLRLHIPDQNTEPSDIHTDLLELPWGDVFTTNYDTLLERASNHVITKRYETVVNKEDLLYAKKPRIIKLHGSFPSERPFIITEEDYRSYPTEFAPFVNTVQQSLLENTFCLIGFSGDDPNFLKWIGWLRDNLTKERTQKIFIIGVFSFLPATLNLLEQRGIIVLNFANCKNMEKNDHKKALQYFIEYIKSKNPIKDKWPDNNLKLLLYQKNVDYESIIKNMQTQRCSYPGWLLVPYRIRKSLTDILLEFFCCLNKFKKLPIDQDIRFAFELNWIIDKCLFPIDSDIAKLFESVLNKYWPFPNKYKPKAYNICCDNINFQKLNWQNIQTMWLTLEISLLRYHRENGYIESWKSSVQLLGNVSDYLSENQREQLFYEEYIFHIYNFDVIKAKHCLEKWNPSKRQPYWIAKRASAIAEIGEIDKAKEQIYLSIIEMRKFNKSCIPDPLLLSQETFILFLFNLITDAKNFLDSIINESIEPATVYEEALMEKIFNQKKDQIDKNDFSIVSDLYLKTKFVNFGYDWKYLYDHKYDDTKYEWTQLLIEIRANEDSKRSQYYTERYEEIKNNYLDPWEEIEIFKLSLQIQWNHVSEGYAFDIGKIYRNLHLSGLINGQNDNRPFIAYSFIRLCEEIGVPFQICKTTIGRELVLSIIKFIANNSFLLGSIILLKSGNESDIEKVFNRENLYSLSQEECDNYICKYIKLFYDCLNVITDNKRTIQNNGYSFRTIQLLPEIISRLCCKATLKSKRKVIGLISEIYRSPNKVIYKNIKSLVTRLVSSMSLIEQYILLKDLLDIPFPKLNESLIDSEYINIFSILPIDHIPFDEISLDNDYPIEQLLYDVKSNNNNERGWYITILAKLYELKLLSEKHINEFAKIIWSKKDENGFPADTTFYKFAIFALPLPEEINYLHIFKEYIKNNLLDKLISTRENTNSNSQCIFILYEIIGANKIKPDIWDVNDALFLLDCIFKFFEGSNSDKIDTEKENNVLLQNISYYIFKYLIEILTKIICPKLNLNNLSYVIKSQIETIIVKLKKCILPILKIEASCLHIFPDQNRTIYNKIRETLFSNDYEIAKDGMDALIEIILSNNDCCISNLRSQYLLLLNQFLICAPIQTISVGIISVINIIKDNPDLFDNEIENSCLKRITKIYSDAQYYQVNETLPFGKILEVRMLTSMLVAQLYKYYKSKNASLPDAIINWYKICQDKKEFSEIKNPLAEIEIC